MNEQEHPEKGGTLLKEPVQQEWVTYTEAGRYSGLSRTTLWRYVDSGDLKVAHIGRSVRIHLATAEGEVRVLANAYRIVLEEHARKSEKSTPDLAILGNTKEVNHVDQRPD